MTVSECLLLHSLQMYGLKEVQGQESDEDLLKLIRTELAWASDDSEIAWCGIYITYWMRLLGFHEHIPEKPYAARSWLNKGRTIDIEEALPGDLVIFWRGKKDGWQGHVSQYVNHKDGYIWCLGGNQMDAVNIMKYSEKRLLGIRRLV